MYRIINNPPGNDKTQGGARKGARGEFRGRGGIAQSPGWSEVKMSSYKDAFHHFVGGRGWRRTKGFHKRLIRKMNVQVRVSLPETP